MNMTTVKPDMTNKKSCQPHLHPLQLMQEPWLATEIRRFIGYHAKVLQLADGDHQISLLSEAGHDVVVAESPLFLKEKTFDVVLSGDLLESCEDPVTVLRNCTRVLKPGGLFFFQSLNPGPWASFYTMGRKEPVNFFTPQQMNTLLHRSDLQIETIRGMRPIFLQRAFLRSLIARQLSEDCKFCWNTWPLFHYCGIAKRIRYE